MWRQIPNDGLTLADVPTADARWDAISEFALSYYCHTKQGSLRGDYPRDQPPLGADLDRLRAWLFSQQRGIRWGCMDDPDEDPSLLAPLRQAIEAIRQRVAAGVATGGRPLNRSAFFTMLGAPLHNTRWSWGAVRPEDGVVFLLVWQDRIRPHDGGQFVQVTRHAMHGSSPRKPGPREREEHVELVRGGARCYLVIGEAADPTARPRRLARFNADEVFVAGQVVQLDGDRWVEVLGGLPVADVAPARAPA